MKRTFSQLALLISAGLGAVVANQPALGIVAEIPTAAISSVSLGVGALSTAGGIAGLNSGLTRVFNFFGGLALVAIDPDPATFLSGKIVLNYPDTLLSFQSIGWFGNFAIDPSLPALPVSSSGFIDTAGALYNVQQAPNPLLHVTTTNANGVLTIEFDASPNGISVDGADHFNLLGITFKNISGQDLEWTLPHSPANFFENPSQQFITCIPPGSGKAMSCGDGVVPPGFEIVPIPEPDTAALLAIGTLAVGAAARRSLRKAHVAGVLDEVQDPRLVHGHMRQGAQPRSTGTKIF